MTGIEDRLTLTSGDFKHSLKKLVAQATTVTKFELDDSRCFFYIFFDQRNTCHNNDQVKVGRLIELNYRDVKLSLSFFTRLSNKDISFTIFLFKIFFSYFRIIKKLR